MMRAITSVPPPAANGTIILIARSGYSALAGWASAQIDSAKYGDPNQHLVLPVHVACRDHFSKPQKLTAARRPPARATEEW